MLSRPRRRSPSEAGYWNDEGTSGPQKTVVSLSDQRAYFYKDKTVIGESNNCTGRKDYETPPGNIAPSRKMRTTLRRNSYLARRPCKRTFP